MAKVAAAPAAHSRSHQQIQALYGLLDQLFGSTWRQHRVEERAQAPSTTSSRNSTGPAEGESPEQAAARAPEACCTEHSDAPLADLVHLPQAALAPPWLPESELPDWRPWEGGAHAASHEQLKAWAEAGGAAAYEQGKGVHAASPEQRKAWAEAAGTAGGAAKAHNKEMNDFVRAQCRDEPLWKDWVWTDLVHVLCDGWAQIIGRELTKKESMAVYECVRQCRSGGRGRRGKRG